MAEPAIDLFHQPTDTVDPLWLSAPTDPLETAFAKFHRDNPLIYTELEKRVLRLADMPKVHRIGIAFVFEAIRYDETVRTQGDAWKLNNNHRALYARLLLHRQPQLADKLETRERHPGAFRRA